MKVLLSSSLCLVCWAGLSANYHAASGYLLTDATNTTWDLDSGTVLNSGFEHWDYDNHGNLLFDTSTSYSGSAIWSAQTRYVLNVHGDPVASFAEYTFSNADYSLPLSRQNTLYFYTNAGRLAGLSYQSDADDDGIWDASGTTQNYYNPRGLLLRSVSNGQDSYSSSRTIRELQWNPRGDLVSYSEVLVSMNPVQTNYLSSHFTVTTDRDLITEDGETDSDFGGQDESVRLEHLEERLSHGLPISVLDESFTSDGELLMRISTTYTWDEHGNLQRDWSKAEYFDGSLSSQISVNEYKYVKRPYLNNQTKANQDQPQMAARILLTPSLKERMLRKLPLRQSKLPNPQSRD